jgi:hypothetical protein
VSSPRNATDEPPRARRLLSAAAALLLYLAYGSALLWPALFGDQVLSASAKLVEQGPFPAALRERAPPALDCVYDSACQFVPWLRFAADAWAADGAIPLWKPTAAAGAPFVGNCQSAVFFPTNFLAMLIGAPPIVHALMPLARLVGGAFCAYLLARHLRLSFAAALLCGLVFGFGGFQMGFYLHTVTNASLLLPLLVLAADRLVLRPTAGRVAALAAVAALQHLAGHAETAFHSQLAVVVLAGVRSIALGRAAGATGVAGAWSALRRPLLLVVAALGLGAALAAVQILPLLEYLRESAAVHLRGAWEPTAGLRHPLAAAAFGIALVVAAVALRGLATSARGVGGWALLLLVAATGGLLAGLNAGLEPSYILGLGPDWFGRPREYLGPGVYICESGAFAGAALPLAALGLLRGRPRGPALVAGAVVVFGILEGATAPIFNDVLALLPGFRFAWNSRLIMFASLGLALLAGFGLDALGAAASRPWPRRRLALLVLVPVLAGVAALTCAVRLDVIASKNTPPLIPAAAPLEARLLPKERVESLFQAEPPARPASNLLYGCVLSALPHDEVVLVFGRFGQPAETRSLPAADLDPRTPAVRGAPGAGTLEAFRATVPTRKLQPEPTRVRVELRQHGRVVALSDVLQDPADDGGTWWPFPARPAAGTTTGTLFLLALALGFVALAPVSGAALRGLRVALPVLVAASLWPFDAGLVALVPRDLFYPPSPAIDALRAAQPDGRLLGMDMNVLGAEIPTYYGLHEIGGYDSLEPARVMQLLDAALGRAPTSRGGGARVQRAAGGPDFALLGLMAVRHLVALDGAPPSFKRVNWSSAGEPPPFEIVENPDFLPRARLVASAEVEPDDERALARLQSPDFERDRSVVLASGEARSSGEAAIGRSTDGSARIVSDRPDLVRVRIEPVAPGWLVLADTFFPGWVARVDGQPREILPANVAFRAVAVQPGDKEVEFRYEPLSYRAGAIVSVLAAGLLAVSCVLSLRRRAAHDAP